jgi:sigma-B regulation protein RsbU (phosphoserine phosphatase)
MAAFCRPAREVGGDYYDLFEPAPGRIVLALGDVTGKGLGASLLTASLHSTLRGRLPARLDDLVGLMSEVNEHLVQSTPAGIFATLFIGLLDTATGRMRYVNGGHPAPMLLRAGSGEPVLLSEGGALVGILPGVPFTEGEVALAPGDMLLVYSDGLSEAMDAEQNMFEEAGVLQALEEARSLDAEPALRTVLDTADRFVAGAEQSDDISLVVVRRTVAVPLEGGRAEVIPSAPPKQQA